MHMRRSTRLTNAFSKKLENHVAAVSLHFMYYNFVRIHETLRVTPAMAAGITERVWDIEDVIGLLDLWKADKEAERKRAQGLELGTQGTCIRIRPCSGPRILKLRAVSVIHLTQRQIPSSRVIMVR